jgi:hypothetical protein
MPTYERKYVYQSNPYKRDVGNNAKEIQNIYYGEVISIEDDTDGGRIKVRIADLDTRTPDDKLPWCYPILPKFFHLYPQVGEIVRIFIEDIRYPQRSRFWLGSVISQLQKINFDPIYTALSTTNVQISAPEPAINTYPDAKGVFPNKEDIALIGRDNTDVILRVRDVEIRAGKNELPDVEETTNSGVYQLNKENPASIRATYDVTGQTTLSSSMIMADKIALISHEGIPKYKAAEINQVDRQQIFNTAHPLGRGDVIVEALELIRKALIQHIHPYSGVPADKSGILIDLEKVDFTQILQKNIVIN